MKLPILALLFALIATIAAAQEVEVTADSFVIDETTSEATFTGNVVMTRGEMKIWADKVVVRYGGGGVNDVKSFDAIGGVKIRTKDQTATGARAAFVPETQILTMSGNVQVESDVGTLTGAELIINLKTQESKFSGGSSGRVTGVFTPQ